MYNNVCGGMFLDADPVCTCGGDIPGTAVYVPDYDNDCESFAQYTPPGEPTTYTPCPGGLIFDVQSCACNFPSQATCNTECKGIVCYPYFVIWCQYLVWCVLFSFSGYRKMNLFSFYFNNK